MIRTSHSLRATSLAFGFTVLGLARSAVAAPQFSKEFTFGNPGIPATLGTYPQDCAATHNNNRAAVRYANPISNDTVISVWQLHAPGTPDNALAIFGGIQNGIPMKSGVPVDLSGSSGGYRPSDLIELTNTIGVSIGSGVSGLGNTGLEIDETYIEVFDIGSAQPQFHQQFVVAAAAAYPDPEYDVTRAGYAHDLAITRDGSWAVFNSDNWIHVLNLGNPKDPNSLTGFNIGKYTYTQGENPVVWNWPCTPNEAVDSIAVTNDRAVVTTAREFHGDPNGPGNVFTTWVYIIDFNGPNGPEIVLEHDLAPRETWTVVGNDDDRPHDVAITPHTDLQQGAVPLAVVTTNHTVAVYNLATNAFLNRDFDGEEFRQYQLQVDSVEMTGERAVVIMDYEQWNPNPPPLRLPSRWRVEVFDLDPVTGFALDPNNNNEIISTEYTGPAEDFPTRSHDLAIDKGFDKGLIRTSFDNVVLTSILNPPPPNQLMVLPSGSDAYAYKSFTSNGHDSFSSDSVAIGTDQSGVLMAATIGGAFSPISQAYIGYVDLIQLGPTVSITQVPINSASNQNGGCVPLDLAVSFDKQALVVRSSDPYFLAPGGSPLEVDLVIIALFDDPATVPMWQRGDILAQYPGNGYQLGTDSLAAPATGFVNTNRRILSITQDPVTGFPGFDYNHIAR